MSKRVDSPSVSGRGSRHSTGHSPRSENKYCSQPAMQPGYRPNVTTEESLRHSSRSWAGRSTDIRIECSVVYTLRCLYMARITSRDYKRFVSHGFCHCARRHSASAERVDSSSVLVAKVSSELPAGTRPSGPGLCWCHCGASEDSNGCGG